MVLLGPKIEAVTRSWVILTLFVVFTNTRHYRGQSLDLFGHTSF